MNEGESTLVSCLSLSELNDAYRRAKGDETDNGQHVAWILGREIIRRAIARCDYPTYERTKAELSEAPWPPSGPGFVHSKCLILFYLFLVCTVLWPVDKLWYWWQFRRTILTTTAKSRPRRRKINQKKVEAEDGIRMVSVKSNVAEESPQRPRKKDIQC